MDNILHDDSCKQSTQILKSLIDILPNAIVICNNQGEIVFYNKNFVYTLPFAAVSKHEEQGLAGEKLLSVVCEALAVELRNYSDLESGEMLENCVIREIKYSTSIYFLNDREHFVLIMRDCCNVELIKEEFKERLEVVITENYLMVKEISQILGESSAKRIKILNSFIKALR